MARTAKSGTHLLVLSANWQALFITATVLSWLSMVGSVLFAFVTDPYVGAGTWVFQVTMWLLPVGFFAAAFTLLRHYTPLMRRVFMACFATTVGIALYDAAAGWEEKAWSSYLMYHPIPTSDVSWWSAYGNEWASMIIGLVVFAGGLYLATRKSRR